MEKSKSACYIYLFFIKLIKIYPAELVHLIDQIFQQTPKEDYPFQLQTVLWIRRCRIAACQAKLKC